nr:unnamed protein product [Callosobruchus chinensis]
MENYLANRPQTVEMSKTFSKEVFVECGVLQGTVLSPLLCEIY